MGSRVVIIIDSTHTNTYAACQWLYVGTPDSELVAASISLTHGSASKDYIYR